MDQSTPLWDVCTDVYFPHRLTITSKQTEKKYGIACRQFGDHLGHPATIADLSDTNLYGFIRWMQARELAATTINDRSGRIKTLWEWMARRKIVDLWPTVERVREPHRTPQAWSQEQLSSLFHAASLETLDVGEIDGAGWWLAWFALAWNTSERVSAILALEWDWLDGANLSVPAEARKGQRRDMVYDLWPETLEALDAIRKPRRKLILPFPYCIPSTFYNRFTRILKRAGLPTDRKHKAHCMRVSHATWVRALSGQSAPNLGHASAETTRKHYEDPRMCGQRTPKLFVPWKNYYDAG